jgi:ribosomal protein S18 acetylase RimI-like enzyme
MVGHVELGWPTSWSTDLAEHVHALIHAVSDRGGAIGWLTPPPRTETDRWLHNVLGAAAAGDAALCTASVDGQLSAMGLWRRDEAPYFHHLAELAKIMAHPQARGARLGATVTKALIESAIAAGIETLQLGVRGNNHLAIELYEELGFRIWGRLPNVIEVGDERFDDVRMFRDLGRPAHLVLHGGAPDGHGGSPSRRRRPADG